MMTFPERTLQTEFNNWLNTSIYISKGHQTQKRQVAILNFIDDLQIFLRKKGYALRVDLVTIAKDWARFMFLVQRNNFRPIHFKSNPDAIFEDYQLFNDTFTYEVNKSFLEQYEGNDDFSMDTMFGPKINNSVFGFIWYYIDIQHSIATKKVDEMMTDSDSDGNENDNRTRRRMDDPYLADQANAASKFNRWD